ncbi:P-loop containing nucleoside triphosphate hydrolase protein [Gamsiella multidivaricata]|uniref:P-loop containing nucleoside triphosphate hydrolase protein n=1 Tax=Gamsiella multidivaricata TaxID=101098 RepID=UPI00221F1F55|nr:P-loop containing nucleoside triphosphate hydrolase protein [Gamsiella multidivaricata]KAI7832651.1 P-loop containing nucleoside triphosphate hydrolase protein [Gamsiella multidivaricata]
MHDTNQTDRTPFKGFVTFLAINCAHFIVEAWPRGRTVVQRKTGASQYEKANFFSRISFHFMQDTVALGYKRPLLQTDIATLMPKRMQAEFSFERLSAKWDTVRDKHAVKGTAPSLMKTILTSFKNQWTVIMILRILTSVMTYVSPQLFNSLLGFIQSYAMPDETDRKPVSLGVILAFGMFFCSIVVTYLNAQLQAATVNLGIEVRTALMSMIYRKALRLSNDARQKSTAGEITNHMSVDAERWPMSLSFLPMIISVPIEIAIAIWMLYGLIGWSIFVGFGAVVLMPPIHAKLSAFFATFRAAKMKAMDSRLRLVNEVLGGMKIVRLYNWEESFKEKIGVVRRDELKMLRKFGVVFSWVGLVFLSTPLVITLVSLAVFATHGGPNFGPGDINPQTIFVSISLFGLLSRPISAMSSTLSQVTSITVATTRIQKFLLAEELDESMIEREPEEGQNDGHPVIEVQNGIFAWFNYSPTLTNISFSVPKGSLTAVVGRVGQGKTSLLSALIGEMYKRQGTIRIRGRIAYVAQQAWIINATLKENITFGLEFNQDKYDRIVAASGLLPDIEMLPGGDMTEIGERGINLSGGQKQRVSLARAAYQDADIYLLDDPLSAVDAHVDQHLWENLLGPNGLLKDKTRLLVTHGIHHLEHVNQIIVVKDGQITENGHYDELMDAKKGFFQLIEEFSVNARRNRKKKAMDGAVLEGEAVEEEEEEEGASETATQKGDNKEVTKTPPKKDDKAAELIAAEKMVLGRVTWGVFDIYLRAASYPVSVVIVFAYLLMQTCQVGTNIWLEHWTRISENGTRSPAEFLGVYAAIVVVYMGLNFFTTYLLMVVAGLRATAQLHDALLNAILRLPMSFFDTTPLGRIVNRFSTDIFATDNTLPWGFMTCLMYSVSVLATIVVIASTTPIFLAMVPPLFIALVSIQRYYIRPSLSLRRIDSTSRSPVYQHFTESLVGVSTIRAMGVSNTFILQNEKKATVSANAFFTYQMVARWLQIRLESLGATIILGAALFSVLNRGSLNPSMVGLALSYALTVTQDITLLVRSYCDLQNQLVSIERVDEYLRKNSEAPISLPTDDDLPEKWPQAGRIEFRNFSTRYRQGLDLVIKNITFEVQPAEKVGIVGRTGAGKSSLTLALFRIIEAANSHWAKANGGSIWIDGVDISVIGLSRLRKHLAIIPQDPTLFAGTVRENLDPFEELQDADLWEALERAHLKDHISSLAGGLSFKVSQNGDNFSVGQRSLICLARALLRKTKILILDEATAAVDVETDELIQKTIRKEFKDRTILTIAHRIKTVMDSDKILVLEKGRVEEYESPKLLLQREDSLFFKLAQQAGEIKDKEEEEEGQ